MYKRPGSWLVHILDWYKKTTSLCFDLSFPDLFPHCSQGLNTPSNVSLVSTLLGSEVGLASEVLAGPGQKQGSESTPLWASLDGEHKP